MTATLSVRNESSRKRLARSDALERLVDRICDGESIDEDIEVSLLFCDDDRMTELNRRYRKKNEPTDVLSFEQEALPSASSRVLGDIVISLETVQRYCSGDRGCMRREIDLLLCHGLLHLLGYDHGTKREREQMTRKQADYLGWTEQAAWSFGPKTPKNAAARGGGA